VGLIQRALIFIICGINGQKVAIVIFPSLPIGLESTVQFVGHVFRLSSFWARVNSTHISSTTRLRQRRDYSRDLDSPDRGQSCLQSRARFKILTECGVARSGQPSGWRLCHSPRRLQKDSVDVKKHGWNFPYGTEARITSGCSKKPSSKAAAREEAGGTSRTSWSRSHLQWVLVNEKPPPVFPTSENSR
jgi:hypothetical protein